VFVEKCREREEPLLAQMMKRKGVVSCLNKTRSWVLYSIYVRIFFRRKERGK
jgi:hypothetical protein